MQPNLLLYSHHTDNELIRKIKGGNAAPYEVLIRRHIRTMYRIARACGATNYEAEHKICETLVNGYDAIPEFDLRNSFRIYAASMIAAAMQAVPKHQALHEAVFASDTDPEEEAGTGIAESALSTSTEATLDTLPQSYRLAYILCEEEGFSVPDAAAILGKDPVQVGERLERARREVKANGFLMAGTVEVYPCPMNRIDKITGDVMTAII